jgi:hypothetical protein
LNSILSPAYSCIQPGVRTATLEAASQTLMDMQITLDFDKMQILI